MHDKSGDAWDDLFRFVLPGYNVRPLEMSGALGIEQLKKVPSLIAGRRENAALLRRALRGRRRRAHPARDRREQLVRLLDGARGRRSPVVAPRSCAAFTAAGIESRPIVAGNFTRNPVMAHLDAVVPDALPAADKVHVDGLFVGNHHFPVHEGIDLVAEVVEAVAAS